jgi:hypothetical protein
MPGLTMRDPGQMVLGNSLIDAVDIDATKSQWFGLVSDPAAYRLLCDTPERRRETFRIENRICFLHMFEFSINATYNIASLLPLLLLLRCQAVRLHAALGAQRDS